MHKKWIRNEGKTEVELERRRWDGGGDEVTRKSQEGGLEVAERFSYLTSSESLKALDLCRWKIEKYYANN